MNRREFLKGTAWMGAMAAMAGCRMDKFGFGEGGVMQNFAMKPMSRIRVGVIGLGERGAPAVHRLSMIPGVEITAICEVKETRIRETLEWLVGHRYPIVPKVYKGREAYKDLCDFDDCDVVYCAVPWKLHQPCAMRALLGGKLPLVEVTAALTLDECWELVEASEKYRIPCMQLENCIYGEIELLELNLARQGVLGELVHAECGYIHDLRNHIVRSDGEEGEREWRYQENLEHKGNRYPTHGLVPICQTFGINRGDRLDYLVSLESDQFNGEFFKREVMAKNGDPRAKDPPMAMGDMNVTLLKTANGKSIMVEHDVFSPRPYSRISMISGTRGIVRDYPFQCTFEERCGDGRAHGWYDEKQAEEIRRKYMHPMWRDLGDMSAKVGGHGGMDFIMDLRWVYCLQNGLPLDMDVYDLAATSCLCELTERSVRSGSKPVDIPDFTRGNWRNVRPWGIVNVDLKKMGLESGSVVRDNAALNV